VWSGHNYAYGYGYGWMDRLNATIAGVVSVDIQVAPFVGQMHSPTKPTKNKKSPVILPKR
jgi:hypothetical protein